MNEQQAKVMLSDMLTRFTVGGILQILAEVLRDCNDPELDEGIAESRRDALGALFVLALGLDSVWPGGDR